MARPAQPILSAEIITVAALRAVDATGDFTMPGIAKELGVRPSSLYTHVSGRAEIVELMRMRLLSGIPVADESQGWSKRVASMAWEYRRTAAKHWRLIPLLAAHTARTGAVFGIDNALAQAFSDGGLAPAEVLHAISTLDSLVIGSVLDLATPDVVWTEAPNANEAMAAALATSGPNPGRADAAFEFGLRTLITGWLAQALTGVLDSAAISVPGNAAV
ncbi:TetR/AcrR family transcriptional regulator C-terminal domain-containing protein [Nocardia sp. CWNU-33]|uniref:TetR/AcrR family transcriptional regulator C-terminal domain-containing protein n=1 Tax=Nocardia sp. CWNU-33 TaxID=3392117 RepID=UPI00398F2C40